MTLCQFDKRIPYLYSSISFFLNTVLTSDTVLFLVLTLFLTRSLLLNYICVMLAYGLIAHLVIYTCRIHIHSLQHELDCQIRFLANAKLLDFRHILGT